MKEKYEVKFYGTPQVTIIVMAHGVADAKNQAEKLHPHLKYAGAKK